MATLFTFMGQCPDHLSPFAFSQKAAKEINGRKGKLDWFATKTLQFRAIEATGPLAQLLHKTFLGSEPTMAVIARLDKEAASEDGWKDLVGLLDQFDTPSCVFRSDGAALALKRDEVVWLSDIEDREDWITFAQKHYGAAAQIFDQAEAQARIQEGI